MDFLVSRVRQIRGRAIPRLLDIEKVKEEEARVEDRRHLLIDFPTPTPAHS